MATKKVAVEKPKTELITKEVNVKTLLKEAIGTVVVIDKETVEKKLKALVRSKQKRLEELCSIEELDKKQLEELKGINRDFRDNRYALQNVGSHNVSALNMAKKNNGAMIDELKLIIDPSETRATNKIKEQDDIATAKKEAEEKAERERVEAIEAKIKEAGDFFEEELEVARKSKDWTKFDEYYNNFESKLEELLEFEFEGTELIEKYLDKKKDILEIIQQAEENAGKQDELLKKEADLEAKEKKAVEDKRRMFALFGIGFMFNGLDYFKDEVKYTEDEINNKTVEDFDNFVKNYKEETEKVATFNRLIDEAKELKLDVTKFVGVETKEALEKSIADFKTEKTEAEAEAERKETEKKAKELKEVGEVVCFPIENYLNDMKLAVRPEELLNEEAKQYLIGFFKAVEKEFTLLKSLLNQDETEEEE